jgi:hypothetical protein
MDRSERMALAGAAVAANARAMEGRTVLGASDGPRISRGFAVFKERHGRPFDGKRAGDGDLVRSILNDLGPAAFFAHDDEGLEQRARAERRSLDEAAVRAEDELAKAWQPEVGEDLPDWIGCSVDEFQAAVKRELGDLPIRPIH